MSAEIALRRDRIWEMASRGDSTDHASKARGQAEALRSGAEEHEREACRPREPGPENPCLPSTAHGHSAPVAGPGAREAALGGGMTITVRPEGGDLGDLDPGWNSCRARIDHRRGYVRRRARAQIAIADLVEIDVQAGAPEKRQLALELRKRWETEGAPVLVQAGAKGCRPARVKVSDVETGRARMGSFAPTRSANEKRQRSVTRARPSSREQPSRRRCANKRSPGWIALRWRKSSLDSEAVGDGGGHARSRRQKALDAATKKRNDAVQSLSTATYRSEEAKNRVDALAAEVGASRTADVVAESRCCAAGSQVGLGPDCRRACEPSGRARRGRRGGRSAGRGGDGRAGGGEEGARRGRVCLRRCRKDARRCALRTTRGAASARRLRRSGREPRSARRRCAGSRV